MKERPAGENPGADQTATRRFDPPGWSVERFAEFWADPDAADVPALVTEDVTGWWPGAETPVRGVEAYTRALADILALLPDMRLRVAEHASNGEHVFVRWILRATGRNGPFELSGIDRIRMREGRVAENIIRFDTAHLRRLAGLQ